jgi:hypothetical protein
VTGNQFDEADCLQQVVLSQFYVVNIAPHVQRGSIEVRRKTEGVLAGERLFNHEELEVEFPEACDSLKMMGRELETALILRAEKLEVIYLTLSLWELIHSRLFKLQTEYCSSHPEPMFETRAASDRDTSHDVPPQIRRIRHWSCG